MMKEDPCNDFPSIEEIMIDLKIDLNKQLYKMSLESARNHPRKKISGCYILVTKVGDTYIGATLNILKRLGDHLRDRKDVADGISHLYIYEAERKNLRFLENYLIAKINPTLNKERLDPITIPSCPFCNKDDKVVRAGKRRKRFFL